MKNLGTIFSAVFVAAVLLLYMCTFQVRFTEVAIKKTWGKPAQDAIDQPGLKFKWPPPIQSVVRYDKRVRIMEDRTEETRTVDDKNLILTTYTLWRIADPARFLTNFPAGEEEGEQKLRTTVQAQKHAIVGQHSFDEFVSTRPETRKLSEIEERIKRAVAEDARREYGIEVVDFGIKKLALPESVTTSIFESMKSHEQAKAARYQAQGEAQANAILAEARAAESRILAAAKKKADQIRTDAERVVSEYYREFDAHPELRIFLDTLETVAEALRYRTTLVISTADAPWDVLDEDAQHQMTAAPVRTEAAPARALAGETERTPSNEPD